jgi:hypothetical protein
MQNDNQPSTRSKDDLGSKAREIGRDLKEQASDLAQSATATVKSQAANVTDQAREVAADVGEKMKAAVADQKGAGADYVGSVADVIRRASYAFDQDLPQAGHYIRQAAAQLNNVSDALRTRDISQLAGDVQDFARKQPAAFFGAAVLAGFAAVRFFKSAPERSDYGSGMSSSNTSGRMTSSTAGAYPGGSGSASYTGASSGGPSSSGSTAGSYTGAVTPRTPGLQR